MADNVLFCGVFSLLIEKEKTFGYVILYHCLESCCCSNCRNIMALFHEWFMSSVNLSARFCQFIQYVTGKNEDLSTSCSPECTPTCQKNCY